ncbi:MAG: PilZ domain-containing protein [Abditibacteriales bacterium]|nr:PilZ domain-containing protein [Abditibacteriales bacterium]MDW8367193.1 PilZ domain-containing protein [Abditibacteriales bacterium]
MTQLLRIAERGSVELVVHQGGRIYSFASAVADVDAGTLSVTAPACQGGGIIWRDGQRVEVRLPAPGGLLLFHTQVLSTVGNPPAFLILRLPPRFQHKRIQRRRYLRVAVSLPVTLFFSEVAEDSSRVIPGTTCDVGGGGVRARFSVPLAQAPLPHTSAQVRLRLPGHCLIRATGRVVRVAAAPDPACCEIAIAFQDISEADRLALLRFVLRHHAERRREKPREEPNVTVPLRPPVPPRARPLRG